MNTAFDTTYKILFWFIVIGCILLGVHARLVSLDMWPLAEDEYYFASAALKTLEKGVPQLECGGYYVRGLLLQYLTLIPLKLFDSIEFSVRSIPSILSILSALPLYLIAKRFGGYLVGVLAVVFFSLSVWEIEFARFARMYSPFQFLFLIYILYLIKCIFESSCEAVYVLFGLSFLSIFFYEGAIFLVALNFMPFFMGSVQYTKAHVLILFVLPFIYIKYSLTNFRSTGVNEEISSIDPHMNTIEGVTAATSDLKTQDVSEVGFQFLSNLPFQLPSTMWGVMNENLVYIIIIGLLFVLGVVFFVKFLRSSEEKLFIYLLAAAILIAALFHMLFLWLSLVFLVLLFSLYLSKEKRSVMSLLKAHVSLIAMLACSLLILSMYLLVYFLNFEGISELPKYFLKYPDFYYKVARLWVEAMPVQTVAMAVLIIATSFYCLLNNNSIDKKICFLVGSVLILFLGVSILETTYAQLKYTFFIYPLVIILYSASIVYILSKFLKKDLYIKLGLILSIFSTVLIFEDYNLHHISNVQAAEINFRENYSKANYMQYYPRKDYRSPGEYINENIRSGELVISIYVPVVAHYLNNSLDFMFWSASEEEFVVLSACSGKKEFWTNANLMSNKDQLYEFLESENNIWVINYSSKRRANDLEVEKYIRDKYSDDIVYSNLDNTIDVYKIDNQIVKE